MDRLLPLLGRKVFIGQRCAVEVVEGAFEAPDSGWCMWVLWPVVGLMATSSKVISLKRPRPRSSLSSLQIASRQWVDSVSALPG